MISFFFCFSRRCIAVVPEKDTKCEKETVKNEILLKMEFLVLSTTTKSGLSSCFCSFITIKFYSIKFLLRNTMTVMKHSSTKI